MIEHNDAFATAIQQIDLAIDNAFLNLLANKRNIIPSSRPGMDYVIERGAASRWHRDYRNALKAYTETVLNLYKNALDAGLPK